MNVALVVLDTLRKDAFDQHFSWLSGRRYENAWSPARWTVPAHKSLFTGRYPREVGGDESKSLPAAEPVLAERLNEAGYTTRAFSANPNISWPYAYDRGFDTFWGSWRLDAFRPDTNVLDWGKFVRQHGSSGPKKYLHAVKECFTGDVDTLPSLKAGIRLKLEDMGYRLGPDDDGAKAALEHICETRFEDDEFLFVNLMEAHEPYLPPKQFRTTEYESGNYIEWTVTEHEDDGRIEQAYEDSVRYLSHIYERIFEELTTDFDLVVTVSDHGELFGEHGAWGHCHGVYPDLVHVPMVISGDAVEDGVDETPVSLLDVYETVCAAAGAPSGEQSRGRNLLDSDVAEDDPILVEDFGVSEERLDGLRENGISDQALNPYVGSFFGVAIKSEYGYEPPSGFETTGGDSERFENAVSELDDKIPAVDKTTSETDMSEEMREQLQDLGYL